MAIFQKCFFLVFIVVLFATLINCGKDSPQPSPYAGTFLHVAVGGVNASSDDGYIAISPDGVTWTTAVTGVDPVFSSASNGSVFVAVGDGGSVYRSVDGTSWTAQTAISTGNLKAIEFDGSNYVAAGVIGFNLAVYTSADGLTWTTVTETGGMATPFDMASNVASVLLATSGGMLRSTNHGASWDPVSTATSQPAFRVTYNTNRFGILTLGNQFATSTNGTSWTLGTAPPSACLDIVGLGEDEWLLVSTTGTVYYSGDNGATWETRDTATGINFNSVARISDRTLIGGNNGEIVLSADNVTFTQQTSGLTTKVNSLKSFAR